MRDVSAIHQFAVSCTVGDGISNSMRFIQSLVRSHGLSSELYAMDRPEVLKDEVQFYEALHPQSSELLLIHHGGGNPAEQMLKQLSCPKVIVYHNITPERFFAAGDPIRETLRYGREQLAGWVSHVDGAIAVSKQNYEELMAVGYSPAKTVTLPLLVDLARFEHSDSAVDARSSEAINLLFVGRLVPHKNHHALIAMLAELEQMVTQPVYLTLVGDGDRSVRRGLERLAQQYGVAGRVEITGKVSDQELSQIYSQADLYVSMSEHEGFGMPLVEAMAYGIPIVAYAPPDSSLVETVAAGGLLLHECNPAIVAATVASLLEAPSLRADIVDSQCERLAEFDPARLYADFEAFLARLGLRFAPLHPAAAG